MTPLKKARPQGTKPQNAIRVLSHEMVIKDVSILTQNHMQLTDALIAAGVQGIHNKPGKKKGE